jgi:O-antigen ligase
LVTVAVPLTRRASVGELGFSSAGPQDFAGLRPRFALTCVLLAAAMPVRPFRSLPLVHSASILDLVLMVIALTLFLDLAIRPIDIGYPELFWLLSIPLLVTLASFVWSHDRASTLRTVLVYVEGMVAYLFVIRELDGVSPARVITFVRRYSYWMILPAVFLLLHVPGFQPRTDVSNTSGDYLTYFSRLSHPVLGPSNNLATVLAFFAPILLYWGHTMSDRRTSRAGLITFAAIVLTLSRGILLAFLVAGLLYLPLAAGRSSRKVRGLGIKVAATIVLGLAALGLFYAVNAPTHSLFKDRLNTTNLTARATIYSDALNEIAKNPFLGLGGGVTLAEPAASTPPATEVNLLSAPVAAVSTTYQQKANVHNTYLQQDLYYGLPLGTLISLALCGTVGVFLGRRRSAELAGVIAYALMVQLVSFLFESSFEGTVLRLLFYLSVGLAAALLRAAEAERTRPLTAL